MPTFRLRAISATVVRGSILTEFPAWNLALTVEPTGDGSPVVSTGEALKDFRISVHFNGKASDASEENSAYLRSRGEAWKDAIGRLVYLPAEPGDTFRDARPPVLELEFHLGETDMTRLLEFARGGRFPRFIAAEVEGVEYCGETSVGEFDWNWDTASKPQVPLTSIFFNIPVLDSAPDNRITESEPTSTVTAPDYALDLSRLVKWQVRTFYVLVAIGVFLLLRLV